MVKVCLIKSAIKTLSLHSHRASLVSAGVQMRVEFSQRIFAGQRVFEVEFRNFVSRCACLWLCLACVVQ